MNFKWIVWLLMGVAFSACGVKGPPAYPKGTEIPPWTQTYMTATPTATPTAK